jgi:Domain of unknown function (DUF4129)
VQLERMTLGVRPRSGWESIDLGFQMARVWWKQTWAIWLALYVPVAAIALLAIPNTFYAVVFLWWLKPLFDRAVLHGLSRLVFGEHNSVAATIFEARDWLRPGLVLALTLRRFELARSFALPVTALEKQTGKPARQRRAILGSRFRGTAVWLTLVCIHLELITMVSLFSLGDLLIPSAGDISMEGNGNDADGPAFFGLTSLSLIKAICYVAAVCLIEPLYVAAGFSLYLNRRTILEGWDLEIRLRQIGNRLKAGATASALMWVCAAFIPLIVQDAAHANGTNKPDAAREIAQVLADPAFEQSRQVTRWRALPSEQPEPEQPGRFEQFWKNIALLLADISQGLLWAAMAIGVAILFVALRKFAPAPGSRHAKEHTPVEVLFGLNIRPDSLPEDIAGTAAALARKGLLREALSLLYRGALATLIHRHRVPLRAGDTESECARSASKALDASGTTYFLELVAAWQQLAYGTKAPVQDTVDALCRNWNRHFAPPGTPMPGASA